MMQSLGLGNGPILSNSKKKKKKKKFVKKKRLKQ
jgi:hypothetical protein